MAKKANTKKVATKKVKPATSKKMDLVDQNPEPSQEVLVEILSTGGETVEIKEPEYEPTAEDVEKAIEVMNGDPTVVTQVENNQESKEKEMEDNSFHSFGPKKPIMGNKKNEDNPHKTTSLVPEKNTEEVQLEEWDNVKPARQKVENKPRSSSFKKIVDYFWNGQEMDF
jgi:hypothetical protein